MRKKRRQPFTPWIPSFQTYNAAFKLGALATEMFMHSAAVIFYRSPIMAEVITGKLSITDPKFTDLWQEKLEAGFQSYYAAFNSMAAQSFSFGDMSFEKNLKRGMKTLHASARPYHDKAKANAMRLTKKVLLGNVKTS